MEKLKLYLLPNLLDKESAMDAQLPSKIGEIVAQLDGLIAESEKGGRLFLSRFATKKPAHQITLALLNKHVAKGDYEFLIEPIKKGEIWGLISDAGLPFIADPAAGLIRHARNQGVEIVSFPGPCSLMEALALSGFPAQAFTFHGYLPKNEGELLKKVKQIDLSLEKEGFTQIFIESPHRNEMLLKTLLSTLSDSIRLCVAVDLTGPSQEVFEDAVRVWKEKPLPEIRKRPAIFLLMRGKQPKERPWKRHT